MGVVTTGWITLYDVNDAHPNLIAPENWVPGTSGTQVGFTAWGTLPATENSIVLGIDPYGRSSPLWKMVADITTPNSSDGGWLTTQFDVSATKTYRFVVYVKRDTLDGVTFSGLYSNGSAQAVTLAGEDNPNPYFYPGIDPPLTDRWYMIVGYVHPSDTTITASIGGAYDMVTGKKVSVCTDFKWKPGTTKAQQRVSYYYCATAGSTQYFWGPRVELCDGSETPLETLLSGVASDYQLTQMASDGVITPQEKTSYLSRWCELINDTACTAALPTTDSGTVAAGEFSSLRAQAVARGLWAPTTASTSKDYYDAIEALRAYLFTSPGVLLASTWNNNITITKATFLGLWTTQVAAYEALSADIQNTSIKDDIGTYTPRCLGLYPYSELGNITGMHDSDLVVLYSATYGERGIYVYTGSLWAKDENPSADQIAKCFLYILIAVSSATRADTLGNVITVAYGTSADYAPGSVSFETLLVQYLYSQNAYIKTIIADYLEAGDAHFKGTVEMLNGIINGELNTPLLKTVPEEPGDTISTPSSLPYWNSTDLVNAISAGKLSASGTWRSKSLAYTYKGASTAMAQGGTGTLYASDRNTWYPIVTMTAPCSGYVKLASAIHTYVQHKPKVGIEGEYLATAWNIDATLEINRNVVASTTQGGTLPAGSTDYSGNYGVVTLSNQSVWVNQGDSIQVWMRHAYANDAYVDSLTIYPENGGSFFFQFSDNSYLWQGSSEMLGDTGTLTLNGTSYPIANWTHYWRGDSFVNQFAGRGLDYQTISVDSSVAFAGYGVTSIYFRPGEYLTLNRSGSSAVTLSPNGYYNWAGGVKFLPATAELNILGGLNIEETTGTAASPTNGSLVIKHDNSGGISSIVFPSKVNEGSDYGFIQYEDSVAGSGTEQSFLRIGVANDISGSMQDILKLQASALVNVNDGIYTLPNGRVGFGKSDPEYPVDVNGYAIHRDHTIFYNQAAGIGIGNGAIEIRETQLVGNTQDNDNYAPKLYFYHQNVAAGFITVRGGDNFWFYKNNQSAKAPLYAASFNTSSLRAQKENIVPFAQSALEIINSTPIVKFNYKDDDNRDDRVGFIADDANPMLATPRQDAFDTTNCVAILMKAVQELSQKNTALEERLVTLESRIATLEAK